MMILFAAIGCISDATTLACSQSAETTSASAEPLGFSAHDVVDRVSGTDLGIEFVGRSVPLPGTEIGGSLDALLLIDEVTSIERSGGPACRSSLAFPVVLSLRIGASDSGQVTLRSSSAWVEAFGVEDVEFRSTASVAVAGTSGDWLAAESVRLAAEVYGAEPDFALLAYRWVFWGDLEAGGGFGLLGDNEDWYVQPHGPRERMLMEANWSPVVEAL